MGTCGQILSEIISSRYTRSASPRGDPRVGSVCISRILFLTEGVATTPAPFETPRYVGRPAFHHFFAYLSLVKNAVFFWKCWVFASCYGDHRHFLAILIRKKGCFFWKCWVFSIFGWGDGQGGPFTGKDAGKTSWQWTSFGASSPGGKIVKMLECRTANRPWSFNRRRGGRWVLADKFCPK